MATKARGRPPKRPISPETLELLAVDFESMAKVLRNVAESMRERAGGKKVRVDSYDAAREGLTAADNLKHEVGLELNSQRYTDEPEVDYDAWGRAEPSDSLSPPPKKGAKNKVVKRDK